MSTTQYEIKWHETVGATSWDGDYITGQFFDSVEDAFAALVPFAKSDPEYMLGEYGIGTVGYPDSVSVFVTFPVSV